MLALMAVAALALSQAAPPPQADRCTERLHWRSAEGSTRPSDIEVLVELRDIGGQADVEAPFTVSPDGRKIALTLRRADAGRNDFCQGIVILDIRSGEVSAPILIGGGVALNRYDLPKIPDFSGGVLAAVIPRWSPDGKWLAYTERRDGIVQIMRVAVAGGEPLQVTHSPVDVRDFSWSKDGKEIEYATRPDDPSAAQAVIEEGKDGYRFDGRWMPEWRFSPFPRPTATRRFAVALSSGAIRAADAATAGSVGPGSAINASGFEARIAFRTTGLINGPKFITASRKGGERVECRDAACAKARQLWWRDERRLLFSSETGPADSLTEIVSWDLTTNKRRRLLLTSDRVDGCRPSAEGLVCAVESSTVPRRLMAIDYDTGAERELLDPNPEWRAIALGEVRRLHWKNDIGLESFGDLVLPPGVTKAAGLPLVVVGYQSRGFLRGGTGDLFPIFPLAARGFAVLVYTRPAFFGYLKPVETQAEADRRGFDGWADKKSGASSILAAIAMLEKEGVVDPNRIGLTGFSDGVDKATYLLIHHNVFRAVAMAGCCSDPLMVNASIGPYLAKVATAAGFPAYKDRNSERVREYSLAANAAHVDTPILIQSADREYMHSLEVEAAFRQEGKPLSLYVFPDEYHIFWQPAHRRAAYARNIDWFEYHLLADGKGPLPRSLAPLVQP